MTNELTIKFLRGKWSHDDGWSDEDSWLYTHATSLGWMYGKEALNAPGHQFNDYPIPGGLWSNQIWVKVEFFGSYTVVKNIYLYFYELNITAYGDSGNPAYVTADVIDRNAHPTYSGPGAFQAVDLHGEEGEGPQYIVEYLSSMGDTPEHTIEYIDVTPSSDGTGAKALLPTDLDQTSNWGVFCLKTQPGAAYGVGDASILECSYDAS